ncbi:MAG: phosphoribosylanthranilate isomerase [Candidatus Latescibacterota bacterium]|nr:MAG: phosphoribosylanthranilate isomerase [Candidatus Latescibacterota bacterium]
MKLVKICGLAREEDVEIAVLSGADLAGFVFAESPRRVTPEKAARLRRLLEGTAARAVGVFCGEEPARIREIAEEVGLDLVQLHGHGEPPPDAIGLPVIRAVRVAPGRIEPFPAGGGAAYYLLDTHDPRRAGGTGRPFDWEEASRLPLPRPFLLAGGLRPETVARAIEILDPDGVDVASGVERSPGVKDADQVRRFIAAARAAWEKGRA